MGKDEIQIDESDCIFTIGSISRLLKRKSLDKVKAKFDPPQSTESPRISVVTSFGLATLSEYLRFA